MIALVQCLAATCHAGPHTHPHAHPLTHPLRQPLGQLIYAASGTMRVRCAGIEWLIPPARAVWIPAGVTHEITATAGSAMRTLHFDPALTPDLPQHCTAIAVAPLLRELVLELVDRCPVNADDSTSLHLAHAAIDCVARAALLPLFLPLPRDPRAVRVARLLQQDPASPIDLATLSHQCGASPRTLQRLFLTQTGLSFSLWRQRLRLIHGAGLLGEGASVTEAGLAAGYASTSAFSAAFGHHFGMTPRRFARV